VFLHVTNAKYLHNYLVDVTFNNGESGVADLEPALRGPVFEPLKNLAVFAQLRVDPELETIAWSNGADLAPEFIYFQAFRHEPALQSQFREWGYI
jgi:hypothetical protein